MIIVAHFIFYNDVQFLTTFTKLNVRLKKYLRDWLLVLDLKECLVECATLCVKSEVILKDVWQMDGEKRLRAV